MILRLRAVEGRTGISRATIYRMVKAGTFPQQVQISPGAVGWRAEEIDAWVASRPAAGTHAECGGVSVRSACGNKRTTRC